MVKIKFIRDFKDCYPKGAVKTVHAHFAKVLIDEGFAKAVSVPQKNKMIEMPEGKKGHDLIGGEK